MRNVGVLMRVCRFTVVILVLFVITTMIASVPNANGLRQVAGKVELKLLPGESQTYRWGLISDIDEVAEIGLRAEGPGSEFISIPSTVSLGPRGSVFVSVNATIPANHPGDVILKPVVYATQSGKPGGAGTINIQMQKTITIEIEPNPDSAFRTHALKPFVQEIKIGESDIQLLIQSSSEISGFFLDEKKKQISFKVSGMAGTNGSAIVPISKLLESPYSVMVDEEPVTDFEEIRNGTSDETSIRINYSHSTRTITITGTNVVPEFPLPILALASFLIALLTVSSCAGSLRNRVQGQ
jgi:hypothetical protein